MDEPWRLTVAGQPPSVNHLYKIVHVPRRGGGGLVSRLAKVDGVESYQVGVGHIVKAARPSGWVPGKRVRLRYWYYLKADADCDNLKKAMNDAIAKALGTNDKTFLSTDELKETGHRKPRVELEISNE